MTVPCLHRPQHPQFMETTLVAVQGVRAGSEAISKICRSLDAWAQELGVTKLEDSAPAGPEGLMEHVQVPSFCLCSGMACRLHQGLVCPRAVHRVWKAPGARRGARLFRMPASWPPALKLMRLLDLRGSSTDASMHQGDPACGLLESMQMLCLQGQCVVK